MRIRKIFSYINKVPTFTIVPLSMSRQWNIFLSLRTFQAPERFQTFISWPKWKRLITLKFFFLVMFKPSFQFLESLVSIEDDDNDKVHCNNIKNKLASALIWIKCRGSRRLNVNSRWNINNWMRGQMFCKGVTWDCHNFLIA